MLINIIRALFIIIIIAVIFGNINNISKGTSTTGNTEEALMAFVMGLAVMLLVLAIDWFTPKKSLAHWPGCFLVCWSACSLAGRFHL